MAEERDTVVMIKARDFDDLPRAIVEQLFHSQQGISLGVRFLSRETGDEITDLDELVGALIGPVSRALGSRQK